MAGPEDYAPKGKGPKIGQAMSELDKPEQVTEIDVTQDDGDEVPEALKADSAVMQPSPDVAKVIDDGMDKATKEITDRIDALVRELEDMKEFVKEDAERVKTEIKIHLGVRAKATSLTDNVKLEMQTMRNRMGSHA